MCAILLFILFCMSFVNEYTRSTTNYNYQTYTISASFVFVIISHQSFDLTLVPCACVLCSSCYCNCPLCFIAVMFLFDWLSFVGLVCTCMDSFYFLILVSYLSWFY